jgi:hypothetical protein
MGMRWLVGMAMLLPIVAMNVRGIGAARRTGGPVVLYCQLLPFIGILHILERGVRCNDRNAFV